MSLSPTFCGILALVMFCFGSVLVVLCLQIMPPFQLGAVIFLIGYILMTLTEAVKGKNLIAPWRHNLESYMGAVSGVGLYTAVMYTAFCMAPAFEVNVLNYLWPVFMMLFAAACRQAKVGTLQIAGAALGFAGTAFLFITPGEDLFKSGVNPGHLLAISGAVIWAAYSIWAKGKHYATSFMGPVMLISALLCLFVHLTAEKTLWPHTAAGVLLIFIMGAFRVSYTLWDIGMRKGDAPLLTSLSYFVPLASTLLMIAFGFRPQHTEIALGGSLIVLSCLVINADKILRLFRKSIMAAS